MEFAPERVPWGIDAQWGIFLQSPFHTKVSKSMAANNKHNRIMLFLKGMAMGAADVVPGVSGGTVAFISGIYEPLINSLTACNLSALKLLLAGNFKTLWQHINGTFLVVLFGGILTSIFVFSQLISWALNEHSELLWAYFFGLIFASVFLIGRQIKFLHWPNMLLFVLAAWLAFEFTRITTVQATPSQLLFFLAGGFAVCAMILPGISGSFLLLLLGMYQPVIEAVQHINALVLIPFLLGCVSGLLSFSHLLSWLLRRFHALTLAALSGFMVGSLNKVWPWKTPLDSGGDANVWPSQYQALSHADPQLLGVVVALCLGLLTVWIMARVSYVKSTV
jgi:putative membrane protein